MEKKDFAMTSGHVQISDLTTYLKHWVIKSRVINKSSKQKLKSGSTLFQVELMDGSGITIAAKFWSDSAEKWYPLLEVGKVYTFSRGKLAVANRQYNNSQHNYELTFFSESQIHLAEDDSGIDHQRSYSFTLMRSIKTSKANTPFLVNVIGVVRSSHPISKIKKKDGTEVSACSISLVDDSEVEFTINFWEREAESFKLQGLKDTVIAFSGIRVLDRGSGRSGVFSSTSSIIPTLEDPRVKELTKWYQTIDKWASFENMMLSSTPDSMYTGGFVRNTIANIKDSTQGRYQVVARISRILWRRKGEESLMYPTCNTCEKKVSNDGSNAYHCEGCGTDIQNPAWKFIVRASIVDHSGTMFVRLFDKAAVKLFDVTASEVQTWDTERKEALFDKEMLFKQVTVNIVNRVDTYGGEERISSTVASISPVDYEAEAAEMISAILEVFPNLSVENSAKIAKTKKTETELDVKNDENEVRDFNS